MKHSTAIWIRSTGSLGLWAPILLLVLLCADSPAVAQSNGNRVTDVVQQFNSIQPWADPLGATLVNGGTDFGSPLSAFYNKHYQGIARAQGPDGTPYLLLARNRNPNKACIFGLGSETECKQFLPGELLTFRMSNLPTQPPTDGLARPLTAGERMGSNLLEQGEATADTVPDATEVMKILFDGSNGMPYAWHPGGMQILDGVLAVPLACGCGDAYDQHINGFGVQKTFCEAAVPTCSELGGSSTSKGGLLFLDVEDPANPTRLALVTGLNNGSGNDPAAYNGAVAITPQGNGIFLVALLEGLGHRIDFYRLDLGSDNILPRMRHLRDTGQPVTASRFTHKLQWTTTEGGNWDREGDCEALLGDDPESVDPYGNGNRQVWDCFQSMSFIRDDATEELFAVLMGNDTVQLQDEDGIDIAVLLGIDEALVAAKDIGAVDYRSSRQLVASLGIPPTGDFDAGTSAYASPSGQLILYSSTHGTQSVGNEDVARMGEFRSLSTGYPHCGTIFHLDGDNAIYYPDYGYGFERVDVEGIFGPNGAILEIETTQWVDPGSLILVAPSFSFVYPWLTLSGPSWASFAGVVNPGMRLTFDLLRQGNAQCSVCDDNNDLSEFDSPDFYDPPFDVSTTFDDDARGYSFCGLSGTSARLYENAYFGGTTLRTLSGSGGLVNTPSDPAFDKDVSSALLTWTIPTSYRTGGLPDVRYHWDFDNNGVWDAITDDPGVSFPFDDTPGTYTVRVRVADKSLYATVQVRQRDVYIPPMIVEIEGYGQVESSPPGIRCARTPTGTPLGWGVCSTTENYLSSVTLTATPLAGSTFVGFSEGICTSQGKINYVASAYCKVTFTSPNYTFTVTRSGNGTVTSQPAGIQCGSDCSESWPGGTEVALTPVPDPGWVFEGWAGDCPSGQVTIGPGLTCQAVFTFPGHPLNLSAHGRGRVTGDGIDCPADCAQLFPVGTTVQLTATADAGAVFVGWYGTDDCLDGQVTMNGPHSCAAYFVENRPSGETAWWPMDGTTEDLFSGYDATLAEGAGWAEGVCSLGLDFTGGSGSLVVPNAMPIAAGDFSIDFWIITSQTSEASVLDKRVVGPQRGLHVFLIDGKPGLQLSLNDGYVNLFNPVSVADGQPHHVAFTVDRDRTNGGRIYVDGKQVVNFDPTGFPGALDLGAPLRVGRRNDVFGSPGNFDGILDELRITRKALTPSEVRARFEKPCLRASWSFEGNLKDSIAKSDGAPVGDLDYGVGGWCRGLALDGTTSSVAVPDSVALDVGKWPETELSFTFWLSTTELEGTLFHKWAYSFDTSEFSGWIAYLSSGSIRFQFTDRYFPFYFATPNAINDGKPHFIAITLDRDQVDGGKVWVDGQALVTFDPTNRQGIIDNAVPLTFGAEPFGPVLWKGMLDEFQIWTTALDAEQVDHLYRDGIFCDRLETGTLEGWTQVVP